MGRQTPAEVTRLAAGGEPLDAAVAAFLTERDLAPSSHRVYVFTLRGGHRGRRRAGPVGPVAVAVADEGEHRLQLRPGRSLSPSRTKASIASSCGRAVLLPDALSVNVRSSGTPSSCRSGFWSRLRACRSPRAARV